MTAYDLMTKEGIKGLIKIWSLLESHAINGINSKIRLNITVTTFVPYEEKIEWREIRDMKRRK